MRPGARLAAAVATVVALACLPASAQEVVRFYSGNDLWSECTNNGDSQFGICLGYVMGITDVMSTGSAILGWRACLPLQVAATLAQDVVKQYLEQHPERRHYAAAGLVAEALAGAFPCKP